ncbi:hypothetical protein ACEWAB_22375 [Vibrio parahaemolyticus]|uniref:hypothetical protein n=1 Tax=Vibrio parahaemolyticus TaxID=670 RepID=UPI000466BED0|nr:hypothetical protein [Vibrio parahaemolyticus]MBE4804584.1 hypothetical protein [Vibrio parahaemolyticus]HCH4151178.1 hypothetical protein [Vibrio parahaemolyticus]
MANLKEQLAQEHYKFLLSKIQHLDEALFKNITMYGKFITSVFAFLISAVVLEKSGKITTELLILTFDLSSAFILFLTLIFALITIANIFSWRDYRKEEMALLDNLKINFGRKQPSFKNLLRWVETWFLFALIIISIVAFNLKSILVSLM